MKSEKKEQNELPSKMPTGEAVRFPELVEYASGSVVSRMLLKNPAGNVTLFSFDAGQGLSEHTAPYDALVQILDGKAEITIDGKVVPAEAGQSVLMPAGVPHSLHAAERFKMALVMIRG